MRIGILALQGGYVAHQQKLVQLKVSTRLVTTPAMLLDIDGLIIPGGESTTMLKLMQSENFFEALKDFHKQGKPILGTCAGAILLATQTLPEQPSLGFVDVTIERNAYGRQLDSHLGEGEWLDDGSTSELMFIRAPKIRRIGKDVETLVRYGGEAVCVRQGNCIIATYHPELTQNTRLHKLFLRQVRGQVSI